MVRSLSGKQSVRSAPLLMKKGLSDLDFAVVQTFYDGQAFYVDACRTQFVASVLEGLFNDEAHADQLGTGLFYQFDDTFGCVSVGQEVVDEQHLVARAEEIAADTDIIRALFGEGEDRGGQHILHRTGLFLLGKNDGEFEQVAYHDGRSNSAGLYRDDFVDLG